MIYTLSGKLASKTDHFFIVECGGIGFKIYSNHQTFTHLPHDGDAVSVFCFLYVREDKLDLYGFLNEQTLKLFEMLNAVSGIGPKTALNVLDLDAVEHIMAAIVERKIELIARASGIGRKTAERVILELHNKIVLPKSDALARAMDVNQETEEALVGLGYQRNAVKKILSEVGEEYKTVEERIKQTLRILGMKR